MEPDVSELIQQNPLLGSIEFDIHAILAGLIYGIIGMWLFRRGRRDANLRYVVVGLLLMIYPYFTRGPVYNWGVGALLCAYAYWW
ncbi:MAG TPA: hypothetical protein VN132_12090 [Bdellovibrio sp.]|nr:hypothetical protein [Bdellovibrio sp.]